MQSAVAYKIEKGKELRVQCEFASVRVISGEVESFGTQIHGADRYYRGESFPLFSFKGAKVSIQGKFFAQENCESSAPLYRTISLDIHSRECPRVLIAGPCDSGKSSLCKTLTSYSLSKGMPLIFADLDPGQSVSVPGSLAALPLGGAESGEPSLVYYYGHASPGYNPQHFMVCIENLTKAIDRRLETDTFKKGGVVVNSCGWVDGLGYTLLKDSIKAMKIETVLVLGEEALLENLKTDFPVGVQLHLVPKNPGASVRSKQSRHFARVNKIREYFWGERGNLRPAVQAVDFHLVNIVRIVSVSDSGTHLAVERVVPSRDLVGAVLGVSHSPTLEDIPDYNVAGFVFVENIDERNNQLIIQCPCPGLPGRFFIFGSVKLR